ncbi:hypothetical protein [Microbulbifer sp. 2205BS26-8]|uniref:hypothetical protein n=1 Tax=Microbulbifer sp. 2205BS26-8 TaxID=3064386 RepID=UPI00273D6F52|nr:hypothetical protein [Microbulbifer sp. 2205BS26-8]MDP5208300.1 hypothetical protein [Microbulbifer sp. 2205BS26-8]
MLKDASFDHEENQGNSLFISFFLGTFDIIGLDVSGISNRPVFHDGLLTAF